MNIQIRILYVNFWKRIKNLNSIHFVKNIMYTSLLSINHKVRKINQVL